MDRLILSFICTAIILVAPYSYAGETCDTGVPGCSVTCPYGDWCVANWKLPDGPCITRCPSKPKKPSVSALATESVVSVKADATPALHTLETKNAPVRVLEEVLSSALK